MKNLWPLAVILAGLACVWLGSCAQIQGDIAADAAVASAVANAIGRSQDIPCFTAIRTIAAAAQGVKPPALLTNTEIALGTQSLMQGPCAPIVGAVALTVLRKTPYVGIAIP